jgi:hypothetical protein
MKEKRERLTKRERKREEERVIWQWDGGESAEEELPDREKEKMLSDEEYFTEERIRMGKIKGIIALVVFAAVIVVWFFIRLKWVRPGF